MATPTSLPATFVAGNVLTAAQMNNLRGAFRVLQVVQGSTTSIATSSSSTFADSGVTVSITPSATTSKVLVIVAATWQKSAANTQNCLNFQVVRGATAIAAQGLVGLSGTANSLIGATSIVYLDSPSTTSATTYKLQFANNANTGTVYVSSDSSISSITVMEISA
jgi:hypothetical protein